jgi:hypothetical protein
MSIKTILLSLLLAASSQVSAAMLYDASLGTTPSAQGWSSYLIEGGSFGVSSGAYGMDTTSDMGIHAFHGRGDQTLDTDSGFTLTFDLRIISETHANDNRAGFSFITIGKDSTRSLEVAFWEDWIWVYDHNGAFIKGAEFEVDTTVRREYRLRVQNHNFDLFVDGSPGISGSMVDYTGAGHWPYNAPSTLIFGDDTGSGMSSVEIYSVQAVPLPPALLLFAAGFGLLRIISGRKDYYSRHDHGI